MSQTSRRFPVRFWRNPIHWLACGFGTGASRIAPGTFGTLGAIPFYLLLAQLNVWTYFGVVLLSLTVGVALCAYTARSLSAHDHPSIVFDEFVGFWVCMFAVPVNAYWIALGFGLFRFFDIVKPWPICWVDKRIGGGLGIMLDDLVAGVFAGLCLHLVIFLTS